MVNAFVNAKLVVPKEGDETDVCEAFEQNRLEGLKDGKQEMYVQSCEEFHCSYKETLERFSRKFHTSKEETKKIVDQYWMVH